ncbi:MAG: hypothetical protein ACLFQ8_01700 [Candidatus Aenigmatarchaeota archaeon]
MWEEGILFFIGCQLIPTPPSPCADFGGQFLLSLLIGLMAPKWLIRPVYQTFSTLGRLIKFLFGWIPLLGKVVYGVENLLNRFFEFASKERESDNFILDKLYRMLLREDIIQRIVFGYFVTITTGSIFLLLAVVI